MQVIHRAAEVFAWTMYGRVAFVVAFLGSALLPSLLRLPTIGIIMTAQIVNGALHALCMHCMHYDALQCMHCNACNALHVPLLS